MVYHGAIDDNARDAARVEHHYLRDGADALLAGKPIVASETKVIGGSLGLRPRG